MNSLGVVFDNFLMCPSKVLALAKGNFPQLPTDRGSPKGEVDQAFWAGKLPSIFH